MAKSKPKKPSLDIPSGDEEFERTMALIKPNATSKVSSILSTIKRAGLYVLKRRRLYMKREQARDFFLQSLDEENNKYFRIYHELLESEAETSNKKELVKDIRAEDTEKTAEKSNMEEYVHFMTNGAIEVLIIAGRGAVKKWLDIIGPEDPKMARIIKPESIRARFGGETILRNAVYGSESADQAEKEIQYFFPDLKSETETGLGASGDYLSKTVNPILLKGLIQLCRQKPDNPLVWLADWLLANNPNTKS